MPRRGADELREIATRWVEEGWRGGVGAQFAELHADDFVDHDPVGRADDRGGLEEGIRALYVAFPDFVATVEDLLIDTVGGTVAVRWSATGTHRGTFLGVAPSGRRITFKGIEILLVRGGLITDRWGEWDGLNLLRQLRGDAGDEARAGL